MSTATAPAYARLPTFSAVIDGLASGLGIKRNKEDALASLGLFSGRMDAYSGLFGRPGLQSQLLDFLTGSDKVLRSLVQERLCDAEEELTNARALPLITEATETEGLQRFIEIWVVPWIAQTLSDASQQPGSVLGCARLLLEMYAASITGGATSYLVTWKAAVRQAIPESVSASEFRSTLARLDQRSQRKHSSIEQDLKNLRNEIETDRSSPQELDAAVDAVRGLYLAGMATMRLCAMATEIIPEQDILALVAGKLLAGMDRSGNPPEEVQLKRTCMYWGYLDPDAALLKEYNQLDVEVNDLDEANFNKLRADSRTVSPSGLLMFGIDYAEGLWHLRHGRNELAERCLQKVVAIADSRQLGDIAAAAASILIALQLARPRPFKFEELNPLMRIRIDNMPQLIELCLDIIPTPFSDRSQRPKPSFYDSHLMGCVAFAHEITCKLGVSTICNPLQRFDESLENLIEKSRENFAKLKESERKRPAIVGTSIKPYQVLRDHLYYRDAVFGWNTSNLPGMDSYAILPPHDQLRLLRFVDPEQFQLDLYEYELGSWRHPDDVP